MQGFLVKKILFEAKRKRKIFLTKTRRAWPFRATAWSYLCYSFLDLFFSGLNCSKTVL